MYQLMVSFIRYFEMTAANNTVNYVDGHIVANVFRGRGRISYECMYSFKEYSSILLIVWMFYLGFYYLVKYNFNCLCKIGGQSYYRDRCSEIDKYLPFYSLLVHILSHFTTIIRKIKRIRSLRVLYVLIYYISIFLPIVTSTMTPSMAPTLTFEPTSFSSVFQYTGVVQTL